MFGVVLWSNGVSGKAVIWCEDQGDLAFMNMRDDLAEGTAEVSPGDLLRFELFTEESIRRARNVCVIETQHAPDLADALEGVDAISRATQRQAAPSGQIVCEPATILPFPGGSVPNAHQAGSGKQQQRHMGAVLA
ncbi:hypothetical protein [Pseudooceanicola nitratireducens]|uniref:hypothetical protein n=1 Tax=Pseudooceanicola nitratireducens TaxID=517719 RepID=UPI001C940953|nr:hypothetical protein [Pseudooceanicola nitratireducens]MBY6157053.1 hypothetical protein [Pseudooceanicola nitratireducens]